MHNSNNIKIRKIRIKFNKIQDFSITNYREIKNFSKLMKVLQTEWRIISFFLFQVSLII